LIDKEIIDGFTEQFPDEADCIALVEKLRWPGGYRCPSCDHNEAYRIQTRKLPLFECRQCGHQTSLTAGTFMHGSKTPISKWLLTIYLVATQARGINAVKLSEILGVTYKTAWLMLHLIRRTITMTDGQEPLSGHVEAKHELFLADFWLVESRMSKERSMIISREVGKQQSPRYKIKLITESKTAREPLTEKQAMEFAAQQCDGGLRSFAINPRHQFSRYKTVFEDERNVNRTKLIILHSSPAMFEQRQQLCSFAPPSESLSEVAMSAREWMSRTFNGISAKYAQLYFDEFCFRLSHADCVEEIVFEKLVSLSFGINMCRMRKSATDLLSNFSSIGNKSMQIEQQSA
jgi:transposase-like protein